MIENTETRLEEVEESEISEKKDCYYRWCFDSSHHRLLHRHLGYRTLSIVSL